MMESRFFFFMGYGGRSILSYSAIILYVVGIFVFSTGCSGSQNMAAQITIAYTDEVLYQVSKQEALNLAQWSVEQVLPEQNVHPLKKPRIGFLVHEKEQKGHHRYARFRQAVYIYEVDLIRLKGNTLQGQDVIGYIYKVRGSGNLKAGKEKLVRIEKCLKQSFKDTGRGVTVSLTTFETPGPKEILSSPSSDIKETPPDPSTTQVPISTKHDKTDQKQSDDVFIKLKKLKELRDQEIITEKEYQLKKKELLKRI